MKSLPYDPLTGRPIEDLEQPGYYPGHKTLEQKNYWDEATRQTVLARVVEAQPVRFFSAEEARIMGAIAARLVPQDDRREQRRIPIVPAIDKRLYRNELNGFRYEDMPPDQEAYHLGLKAINEMAQKKFHAPLIELTIHQQELVLKSLHNDKPDPEHEVWKRMPVHRFWTMMMEDCVTIYYSHPWAWDEIGFGGPAYPRAYTRLENGLPEPWEVDEQRYEWSDPVDSLSGLDLKSKELPRVHAAGHGGIH
jgi:hypothetical protein